MLHVHRAVSSRLRSLVVAAGFLGALSFASAQAADVYVVHGINGTDLGLTQTLPVDVSVDGSCAITDFQFKETTGPVTLATGSHSFEVKLSDGTCTGALAISGRFDFAVAEKAVIVAHLDGNGVAKLSKFTVNSSTLAVDAIRLSVLHLAAAPAVNVDVRDTVKKKNKTSIKDLENGQQTYATELDAATFNVKIKAATGNATVLSVNDVPLAGNVVVIAVGSLANDTLDLIAVTIA